MGVPTVVVGQPQGAAEFLAVCDGSQYSAGEHPGLVAWVWLLWLYDCGCMDVLLYGCGFVAVVAAAAMAVVRAVAVVVTHFIMCHAYRAGQHTAGH